MRILLACLAGLMPLFHHTTPLMAQTQQNLANVTANTLPPIGAISSSANVKPAEVLLAPTTRVQTMVDEVRARLVIPQEVVVSIVEQDKLLVSVERLQSGNGQSGNAQSGNASFALNFERDFLDSLNEEELQAVVAHELGHVWIFTHHPYLQTEELANQVALRLVSRDTLDKVYKKVWQRTGSKGDLAYLPPTK